MSGDRFCAIIVAAGRSERTGEIDKLWAPLTGRDGRQRPLLSYAVAAFQRAAIDRIALVVAADAVDRARALVVSEQFFKVTAVIAGGVRRQDSVRVGLDALESCDYVAVHDGARPLVTEALIELGLVAAEGTGAACCAIRAHDTVKESRDGRHIDLTMNRSALWLAQTPQIFRYDLLLRAHDASTADATDDAAMVEALGVRVCLFEGSHRNIKVTTQDDLPLAQALLVSSAG